MTAVSVAYECKMIKPSSQVIIVSCCASEEFTSPWILFEEAEMPQAANETAMNGAITSTASSSSVDETHVSHFLSLTSCEGQQVKEHDSHNYEIS